MNQFNKLIFILLLAIGSLAASAQNYTWTQEPSLPFTLFSPASFAVGTHVYVFGGFKGPYTGYPCDINHEVWDFNTTTSTWSQKANFPGQPTYGGRGFSIGTLGYLVSGWDSTGSGHGPNTTWEYDPATDTWTQRATFPGATRYTTASFAVSGKGYVACGFSPYTNEVWCFDPAANTWTQKANFPGTPRQDPSYFVLGNLAYVGLGATSDNYGGYFLESDFYKYDPSTDTWTLLNYFPGDAASGATSFTVGGEGYVVTGNNQNSVTYNSLVATSKKVWKYDPATDGWALLGLFPDSSTFGGTGTTSGLAGYTGFGAYNFALSGISRDFYRYGPGTAPYSCDVALDKFQMSNAVYNFQTRGNFSPTAVVSWTFGDGQTGSGTSVIHNYTATGTYHINVTVTDTAGGGCTASDSGSVAITNINNCSAVVNSTSYGTLFHLSATVTGGVGPYTYQWATSSDTTFSSTAPNPSVTVPLNSSANYCVTITDASGCVTTACKNLVDSQIVFSACQIIVLIYPDPNVPGSYYGVFYTSGSHVLTYLWDFGDGTTSTLPLPSHTYATPGRYTVCVTASDTAGGCSFTFCDSSFYAYKYGGGPMKHFGVTEQRVLGVDDVNSVQTIAVYPNPTASDIRIDVGAQNIQHAAVYNVNGQKVMDVPNPSQNSLHVSQLPDGVYMIEVKTRDASAKVKFAKLSK